MRRQCRFDAVRIGVAWLALFSCFAQARYTCRRSYATHGHITCQRRNPQCHIIDDHRLIGQERKDILLSHNRIRREAAKGLLKRYGLPAAANMKKLEWDEELANNAQAHAEVTCQLKHDHPNERFTGLYPEVGQNIYITEVWNQELKPDTWTIVVEELWGHDEAAKLRASSFGRHLKLRGHDLKTIGHLTQLLWADTERVGCGKIVFDGPNGATGDLRTCDYGEGGNVIGGELYIEGEACSACPATHPYCDDGLCSRVPVYNPTSYVAPAPAPAVHVSYAPVATTTAAVQPTVTHIPVQTFWWNPPKTFTTSLAPTTFQYKAVTQSTYRHPNSYNHSVNYNPYIYHHQSPPVQKKTYNYKNYTVLRRRKRSAPAGGEGRRRTRVL